MGKTTDEHYVSALRDVQHDLQAVKSSGGYLVWLGFLTALTLIAGIGVTAYAWLGHQQFMALSPFWYLAGGLVAAGPGFACIAAGFMARQSLQTARANAIVLRASQMLLMPAEAAGTRITRIGESVRHEAAKVDEIIENSHASLADLRERLARERDDVEKSVIRNGNSIATIMDKMSAERQALAELTSAVAAQAVAMSDAIPRQARMMADAARAAYQDIAKSDEALNARLVSLDKTAHQLTDVMSHLGELSERGEERTADLVRAISNVEERLRESAKVVDAAIRASELASLAATETSDSLNAAVASALDGTREASDFIRRQSKEASGEAMKAMAELKQTAHQAEQALIAVGAAAKSQASDTEQRIEQMSEYMYQAATRATSAAEAGLERARLRIERASALLNGLTDEPIAPVPSGDPREFFVPPPVVSTSAEKPVTTPLRQRQAETPDDKDTSDAAQAESPGDETHDDMFEADDFDLTLGPKSSGEAPDSWLSRTSGQTKDLMLNDDERSGMLSQRDSGLSWKDLLAGLDTPAEERDEAARFILSEIEESGIALDQLFVTRTVKKIASATRRGERHRRRMVREFAGTEVQSLVYRLQDDIAFRNSADRFLTVEEPDALRALTEAEKSRSTASARLSAYLLLDAASGST